MKKIILLVAVLSFLLIGCSGGQLIFDLGELKSNHVLGKVTSPVRIVAYTDFQCDFCAKFHQETLPKLKAQYIDTGKVSYELRDFPLISVHKQAFDAAKSAYCAGDQDAYWQAIDLIFANSANLNTEFFESLGEELRLPEVKKYQACLKNRKYDQVIEDNLVEGANLGVLGPPTFFVNGVMIQGAQDFSNFEEVINNELAKNQR